MFRQHPKQIECIVQSIMIDNGLATMLQQRRILNEWDSVVGDFVARNTVEKTIRNQTLYVRIPNPALRSELSMRKTEIINALNAKVSARVICDLRIN